MSQPDDCIFCKILSGALEASMVYQDDCCSAFMDIQPINPGHALVVPNRHAARLERWKRWGRNHLIAAQESGAEKEAEEIKKRLAKLP